MPGVIESTPSSTDRKVVLVVVIGLVAIIILSIVEYAVLAKWGVKLELLIPLSNIGSVAVGSLGTMLASTRSSPPGPTTEDTPEPPAPPTLGPGQAVVQFPPPEPAAPTPPAGFFGGGD